MLTQRCLRQSGILPTFSPSRPWVGWCVQVAGGWESVNTGHDTDTFPPTLTVSLLPNTPRTSSFLLREINSESRTISIILLTRGGSSAVASMAIPICLGLSVRTSQFTFLTMIHTAPSTSLTGAKPMEAKSAGPGRVFTTKIG
jgi:hypothetical protein